MSLRITGAASFFLASALSAGLVSADASSSAALATASQQVRAVPASQSTDQVAERLSRIEVAVRDLQGAVYAVEPGLPTPVAGDDLRLRSGTGTGITDPELALRLSAIEEALAELTGRVEEVSFRLDRLEAGGAAPTGSAPSAGIDGLPTGMTPPFPVATDDSVPQPGPAQPAVADGAPMDLSAPAQAAPVFELPDDPDAAYDIAYNAVLAADYDRATVALEAFVAKFPEDEQTPEAMFLLGDVYLATGQNREAGRVFLNHVEVYPNDVRAPEAYLKLGIAFARQDLTQEACQIFRVTQSQFPDLSDRLKRRLSEEEAAAGCR